MAWRHWRSPSITEPLRCSLNVSFHFPGLPLEASLDGAVTAGFRTIELLDPYAVELDELERALRRRGLRLDLFNLPMGDFAAGERGFAGDPGVVTSSGAESKPRSGSPSAWVPAR